MRRARRARRARADAGGRSRAAGAAAAAGATTDAHCCGAPFRGATRSPTIPFMERLLRAALAATMSILLVAGGTLALTQAGPDDLATLQAAPWTLSELDGQSIDASTGITAAFGADGSLAGSAGCNDYFGDYTTDGAQLTVAPLAATRKACDQDVMDTETLFLSLLESAATWSLDGSTLTVTSGTGVRSCSVARAAASRRRSTAPSGSCRASRARMRRDPA